jgi:plastocyanin
MFRTPLVSLTTVALAGCGTMFVVGVVLSGDAGELDLMIPAMLLLGSAGLAASRLQWGPLPGVVIGFGIAVVGPFFQDYSRYHLTHPEQLSFFVFTLLLHVFGVVAAVAGAVCLWHRYRGDRMDRADMPRWAALGVTALGGAVAGAVAVAATVASAGAAVSNTPLESDPAVPEARFVAEDLAFTQAPERVAAGVIAVMLRNDGALHHDIAVEGVDGGRAVTVAAPGSTTDGQVRLVAGTYTYFCSVPGHREAGMEGELRVGG